MNVKKNVLQVKKLNEIMNKNALKIEKQLLSLFDLDNASDDSETDESVTKKIKIARDGPASVKQIGFVIFPN